MSSTNMLFGGCKSYSNYLELSTRITTEIPVVARCTGYGGYFKNSNSDMIRLHGPDLTDCSLHIRCATLFLLQLLRLMQFY